MNPKSGKNITKIGKNIMVIIQFYLYLYTKLAQNTLHLTGGELAE